jgi:predicted phage terminase large subunit-like protein
MPRGRPKKVEEEIQEEQPKQISIEELAYSRLLCYAAMQFPGYKIGRMHEVLADHLEAVERGDITRLMVFAPPRHGKTQMVSEFFPAWFLGRNPDKHIISCSYSQTRANDVGRKVRNQLDDPVHRNIFPHCTIAPDMKSIQHFSTEQNGEYFSMGVGGSIVGRGAHCVCSETVVDTNIGLINIKELHDKILNGTLGIKVLSLDDGTGIIDYNNVLASRESFSDNIYTIATDSGNRVRSTGNHRFFVQGRGYVNAEDLSPGDRLVSKKETPMPSVQESDIEAWNDLPKLLPENAVCGCRICMRLLRKEIIKESVRNKKGNKKRAHRTILFKRMLGISPCSKKLEQMPCMRKDNEAWQEVLFLRLHEEINNTIEAVRKMSCVRGCVCKSIRRKNVLFKEVFERLAFIQDGRSIEPKLQRRNELLKIIRNDETSYNGKRFGDLLQLRFFCEHCPSYQREHIRQPAREPHNSLHQMPLRPSQIEVQTVASIERCCSKTEPVYDIQVERVGNFFANEILTHNCFLIDDPIKDRASAESTLERKKMQDWYRGVAYTRLMVGGRIIIINTRWHEDDLSGWLLREHSSENWTILNMPALAEDYDVLGREPGEALWPEAYPLATLNKIKTAIGSYEWNSQYQQRPVSAEGSIIKREWIRQYNPASPLPQFNKVVLSCDTAFKATELSDPTAILVWGVTKNEYYLLDVVCKRMEFHETKRVISMMMGKWNATACLIEDRSSGQSLVQEFKRISPMPVIPVKTMNVDKVTRFSSVSHYFESGSVLIPSNAAWLVEYETQITTFPYDKHDDMVDATSQFLIWCSKPRFTLSMKPLFWK